MQREAERLIYAMCADAAGPDVPVVFAAYNAPLDKYPRVRIQAILGPDEMGAGRETMKLATSVEVTVTAGPAQLVLANQVFFDSSNTVDEVATALVTQIRERTEWTVSEPSNGVFSVTQGAGRPLFVGHSSADFGCTLAETEGSFVNVERVKSRSIYQITVFSTESRTWLPFSGSSWIASRVKARLRNAYASRDSIDFRAVRTLPSFATPSDRAGYVMATSVEFECFWTEPVQLTNPNQIGRIECVEVSVNGESLEINQS